jgi:hypothetical protein
MIDIKRTPQRAHSSTAKVVSFHAKIDPVLLIQQLDGAVSRLAADGYVFPTVSFRIEESDFGADRAICTITAGRMETQEECDKRVLRQERSNANELQATKEALYIQQKRKEFNRLTSHLSLEQLQSLLALELMK